MRTTCPVCRSKLAKTWHLVCASCWAKVSAPLQARVYDLWRRKPGSPEHRRVALAVVRLLIEKRRATA